MDGGSLSDQQLKEFDAYLSGEEGEAKLDELLPEPKLPSPPPPPKPVDHDDSDDLLQVSEKKIDIIETPVQRSDNEELDDIIRLHQKKINIILGLLDKIDAKANKGTTTRLVDEMQYQKSVVAREREQGEDLKKLLELARAAAK